MQNAYGNYFIQDVLEQMPIIEKSNLHNIITSNILNLANQKHSSNVVIKMLENCGKDERKKCFAKIFNIEKLSICKKNKYLNNVTNKAIEMMSIKDLKHYIKLFQDEKGLEIYLSIFKSRKEFIITNHKY